MDYKEEYERALSMAKMWYRNTAMPDNVKEIFSKIFPELKESEDERIRKEIIETLNNLASMHYPLTTVERYKEWIAWLEKQVPVDVKIKGVKQGIALSIIDFLDKNTTGMDMSSGECKGLEDAILDSDWMKVYYYMKKKLEKQDEKKSANEVKDYNSIDPHFYKPQGKTALEAIKEEKVDNANKVETMFNVGDWVVKKDGEFFSNGRKAVQITNIAGEQYWFDCGTWLEAKDIRLWTIQDAEDGDVLVNGANIFIFHCIGGTRVMGYCHLNTGGWFFYNDIGKNECFCLTDAVVTPATKEQRDLLFQKMRDADYKWDAENKCLLHK